MQGLLTKYSGLFGRTTTRAARPAAAAAAKVPWTPRALDAMQPYSTAIGLGVGGAAGAGTYALTGDPIEAGVIGGAAGAMFRPGVFRAKYNAGVASAPRGSAGGHDLGLDAMSNHALKGTAAKALIAGGFAAGHALPKLLQQGTETLQNVQDTTKDVSRFTGELAKPGLGNSLRERIDTGSQELAAAAQDVRQSSKAVKATAEKAPAFLDTVGDAAKNIGQLKGSIDAATKTVGEGVNKLDTTANKAITAADTHANRIGDAVTGATNWGKQNANLLLGGGVTVAGLYALSQWYQARQEEARREEARRYLQ